MRVKLSVKEGPHAGREFEFHEHDSFIVGRSARAQFRLPLKDASLSRVHFMVEVNPPQCRLTDLGSTNGTKVNGRKIKAVDLADGDLIAVGVTILLFSVTDDEEKTVPLRSTAPMPVQPNKTSAPPPARPSPGAIAPIAAIERNSSTASLPSVQPAKVMNTVFPTIEAVLHRRGEAPTNSCSACAGPLPVLSTDAPGAPQTTKTSMLCPVCIARARDLPQPVDGYEIIRELGRGGMGIVYLAYNIAADRLVAIKIIRPAIAADHVQVERFLREARILQNLDHPHIVAFLEMQESQGVLLFAMEYVRGTDSARARDRHGRDLPVRRAVDWVRQMLQALDYAHAKGFVHRDIKPSNMLVEHVGDAETIKLADFGLARMYQNSTLSGLTMKGDLAGTISFMAPEQILRLREAKPPVDIYAAGASLYWLLSSRHIYNLPDSLEKQILTVLEDPPVPIRSRRPDIPMQLADVIHRALSKDPEQRFANAADMSRALLPFC